MPTNRNTHTHTVDQLHYPDYKVIAACGTQC